MNEISIDFTPMNTFDLQALNLYIQRNNSLWLWTETFRSSFNFDFRPIKPPQLTNHGAACVHLLGKQL